MSRFAQQLARTSHVLRWIASVKIKYLHPNITDSVSTCSPGKYLKPSVYQVHHNPKTC